MASGQNQLEGLTAGPRLASDEKGMPVMAIGALIPGANRDAVVQDISDCNPWGELKCP